MAGQGVDPAADPLLARWQRCREEVSLARSEVVVPQPDGVVLEELRRDADLLAGLIPEVRYLGRRRRVLEGHEHHGLAGLRVALDVIKTRSFLELLFESVRHLL